MKRFLASAFLLCTLILSACSENETSITEAITTPELPEITCPVILEAMPLRSITSAFNDALYALERGDRVLLILLDGWGWEKFAYHASAQPFLSSLNPESAIAVYPPMTPVGLASVLTGVQPEIHGIQSRNDRQLSDDVTDIFAEAARLGKTAIFVQGATNVIETSLFPLLSPDADGLYGTDNEVFENAKRNLDADLLFVHFKGIDDTGHTYGPFSEEVGARLALIDEYIHYLAGNWGHGTVIITADHGMHQTHDDPHRLGNHYRFCHEDIIVPYIIVRKGGY